MRFLHPIVRFYILSRKNHPKMSSINFNFNFLTTNTKKDIFVLKIGLEKSLPEPHEFKLDHKQT